MKIALCQINITTGNVKGNLEKILRYLKQAEKEGADIAVFPETALTGYPAGDLWLDENFIKANLKALDKIRQHTFRTACVVGYVDFAKGNPTRRLNCAAMIHKGKTIAVRAKSILPNFGIFEEERYFVPAKENDFFVFKNKKIALTICADVWAGIWENKPVIPDFIKRLYSQKADLHINISASPFYLGKPKQRFEFASRLARETNTPLISCNIAGGADAFVFDGNSLALDAKGRLIERAEEFDEDFLMIDLDAKSKPFGWDITPEEEDVYRALVLGTRDFVYKCGLKKAVIGLSGGIDSAVVCAIAVAALGKKNVSAISMPSPFSSKATREDAKKIAKNLGIEFREIPITPLIEEYKKTLPPQVAGYPLVMENLQARIRANILMAHANKAGAMLLATGNKTEIALGYCTLYGDTCGGLAPIADLVKNDVQRLARWINRTCPACGELIPRAVINRAPSAELRHNQKDEDDIPPYSVSDGIVKRYAAGERPRHHSHKKTITRIEKNEFKRKQLPVGLMIYPKGFTAGRKMPVARWFVPVIFAAFLCAGVRAQSFKEDKKTYRPATEAKTLNSPSKKDILDPLESAPKEDKSFADKVLSKLIIDTKQGPIFFLPIIDSSKDLGANAGIMPIWALRDDKRQAVKSVIAPSINYNRYLKTTFTYRQYFFPDDKQLWVGRGSISGKVQREIFLRYFNPEFCGTKYRINAEFHHFVNGKFSYYGIGPNTHEKDKATYALAKTGEEFSVSVPVFQNFYFDFTHQFFQYTVGEGPVPSAPQLSDKYPEVYELAHPPSNITMHRLALFYDSTDHPEIPKNGIYAGASASMSVKDLISDYSFTTYAFQVKKYYNHKKQDKFITAFNAMLQDTKGPEIPFYAMPVLGENTGIRAFGDGRFRDGGKLIFNLEERITITRLPVFNFFTELEISPFVDAGTVFGTMSGIKSENMKFGYGIAARVVIKPQVVAAADFAFGPEGPNVIIHVGYPF